MAGNTIGKLFTVTSFGESHGPAIGCIVDGCPPGLEISAADLQPDLDRRKPGQSRYTTQRKEDDEVQILSGIFEGKTNFILKFKVLLNVYAQALVIQIMIVFKKFTSPTTYI